MKTTTLSQRGLEAPTSPIRALEATSREASDAGKTVHFGAAGMSDFTLHGDEERKQRYLQRHSKNENDRKYKSNKKNEQSKLESTSILISALV